MERLQTTNNLDEDSPNIVFMYILLLFLVVGNFLEKITVIGVFHYDTVKYLS